MRIVRMLGCLPLAAALGGCWTGIYENPFAQYVNRSDTVTLSAGDAKNVNAATHVVDPWPRYVGNKNLAFSGERMQSAVECYRHNPRVTTPVSPSTTTLAQQHALQAAGTTCPPMQAPPQSTPAAPVKY